MTLLYSGSSSLPSPSSPKSLLVCTVVTAGATLSASESSDPASSPSAMVGTPSPPRLWLRRCLEVGTVTLWPSVTARRRASSYSSPMMTLVIAKGVVGELVCMVGVLHVCVLARLPMLHRESSDLPRIHHVTKVECGVDGFARVHQVLHTHREWHLS